MFPRTIGRSEVEEVIGKGAMAKKPPDRFASAGELATAVTEAGRGRPSRRARKRWMTGELDAKLAGLEKAGGDKA